MKISLKLKKTVPLLLLIVQLSAAQAEQISWLSYPGRLEVSRTTVMLARGYPERALQQANKLSGERLDAAERLVLAHNSCIALNWLDRSEEAVPHCKHVRQADQQFILSWQRGANLFSNWATSRSRTPPDLLAVLAGSLSTSAPLSTFRHRRQLSFVSQFASARMRPRRLSSTSGRERCLSIDTAAVVTSCIATTPGQGWLRSTLGTTSWIFVCWLTRRRWRCLPATALYR